jgi:hypothetical protein
MASMLDGVFTVPAGTWFAAHTEISLAFIGAAILFLPLFVFLPKLIQRISAFHFLVLPVDWGISYFLPEAGGEPCPVFFNLFFLV